jgi:Helix-turn-helix domain
VNRTVSTRPRATSDEKQARRTMPRRLLSQPFSPHGPDCCCELCPPRRSPLLHKGERFAMTAKGWFGKLGNPTNFAVFTALAFHAGNPEREAWPGKATIAEIVKASERTIQRSLRDLVRIGAITLLSLGQGDEPSHYRVNLSPTADHYDGSA